MTDKILRGISFFFHPLFMPLLGVIFYFSKTPRYIPQEVMRAKLISLGILTIILPILIYFLLNTIRKANSIYLKTTKERILPLAINSLIILIILKRIITPTQIIELYYFFVGILISNITCLILAIMKFKASIHMIAVSGVFMFFIAISIHFSININGTLALMVVILGAVATSRLHLKAHNTTELILGFFIGLLPQLILVEYWL